MLSRCDTATKATDATLPLTFLNLVFKENYTLPEPDMFNIKKDARKMSDIQKVFIFFAAFVVWYCLSKYFFRLLLSSLFSDVSNAIFHHFANVSAARYHEFDWWHYYGFYIILFIPLLTCVFTAIFKRKYFKISAYAFVAFIVVVSGYNWLNKLYEKHKDQEYNQLIIGKWEHK